VHEGIRYVCNVCSENMSSKELLYEHYFAHRGFRPYHCNVCPYEGSRKRGMVAHLKQHNVALDVKIHGYIELDPDIHKIIEGCVQKTGYVNANTNRKDPKKMATATNKAAQYPTNSLSVDNNAETSYQSPMQDMFYN
jgi:hypothetical protein